MNDESDAISNTVGERRARGPLGPVMVTALLLSSACAQAPAPAPAAETVALEQRLQTLEQRFDSLERYITNLPSPPLRSRDEIERNIQSLEARRTALLERYTSAHPLVREVDLSLRLLRLQLEMLDQAHRTAK
jgi:hypothetical protein